MNAPIYPPIPHPSSDAAAATAPGADAKVIEPLFDHPLRDTSICLAGDGWFYLTGTVPTPQGSFENDGIYVWKSEDLKQWRPLGKVWDIERDGTWQKEYRPLKWYERRHGFEQKGRALWAPEIHWIKEAFWLTYCMSYGGTGLLKSVSGKAEGPYEEIGQMTDTREIDASLFEDDDGTVYWVYQNGKIARMKDDMSGLAEEPHLLQPALYDFHENYGRRETFANHFNPDNHPQVGFEGAFLFKHKGQYHLAAGDDFRRFGEHCYDLFIVVADNIYGPYSPRYLAVPHAGHTTVFKDKAGRLYCTMFGSDKFAAFRHRPAIIPLEENDFGFLRASTALILERGPIAKLQPVGDLEIRDPQICPGHDGQYYMVGTTRLDEDPNMGIEMFCSDDLKSWDSMGFVFKAEQSDWLKEAREPYNWHGNSRRKKARLTRRFWAPELHYVNATYYLTYSLNWGCTGILKSLSGKPEGPYADLGRMPHKGIDSSIFQDDDGRLYYVWLGGMIAPLNEAMNGFTGEPQQLLTVDGEKVGYEGGFIVKINDKYVLGAAEWNGDQRVHGTYDLMYAVSDTLYGPYSSREVAIRHGGHGTFFKTHDGRWMSTLFGNDRTAPFRRRLGIVPLDIVQNEKNMLIEPSEK